VPTLDRAAISRSHYWQRGFSLLPIAIILLLSLAIFFASSLFLKTSRASGQVDVTLANLTRINEAIIAYVAVNGRLPCPADPATLDGRAKPETPTTACTNGSGVVPWATLGISQDVVQDGWYRVISYRVLDGATGLTQDNGASMVNCDIKIPYGPVQLPGNGLCQDPSNPATRNLDSQFLAGKGLQVNNAATILSNSVAYVLISHGESGYGAYFPNGNRLQLPTSAHELANTNAGSPFYQDEHSAPGTDPIAATHFDDILLWTTIVDLAKKAGLTARDWPDPPPPSISATTLQDMNTTGSGHFNATTTAGGDTFSATSTTSEGAATTTLAYGAGAGVRRSSCAWWPTAFNLYNGADRLTLRLYLEFATEDALRPFSGFTVGFLPGSATINNQLCGDETLPRGLGWDNGTQGNIPPSRFAVEFDAFSNSGASDPPYNHLAIDFNGTNHGSPTSASLCSTFADTYHNFSGNPAYPDCYTGSDSSWLRNGLTRFHRLRIEVTARDTTCPSGEAPRIKVWILPESVCPDGTADTTCLASKQLSQPFTPPTPLPAGIAALNRCVAAPSTAFDQMYFGITASNRSGTSDVVYFRNLDAAVY
jgi:hypothetical protein